MLDGETTTVAAAATALKTSASARATTIANQRILMPHSLPRRRCLTQESPTPPLTRSPRRFYNQQVDA
jgi:hypothetical protein